MFCPRARPQPQSTTCTVGGQHAARWDAWNSGLGESSESRWAFRGEKRKANARPRPHTMSMVHEQWKITWDQELLWAHCLPGKDSSSQQRKYFAERQVTRAGITALPYTWGQDTEKNSKITRKLELPILIFLKKFGLNYTKFPFFRSNSVTQKVGRQYEIISNKK